MSKQPLKRTDLDVGTLIKVVNSLQMALSKLLDELLKLQRRDDVYVFTDEAGTSVALDEACEQAFDGSHGADEACGPFDSWAADETCRVNKLEQLMKTAVDESCGPEPVDESCGDDAVDESCGAEPVDESCGDDAVDESCGDEAVDEICSLNAVDEPCVHPVIPEGCDAEALGILCSRIIKIAIYIRKICWIVDED